MRTERLLDAIGNLDDKLIEEAAPWNHKIKKPISWTKLGSLAACICLFAIGIWAFDFIVSNSFSKAESPADTATPEMMMEEAALEEESVSEEAPAEEVSEEEASDITNGEHDVAYSFTLNNTTYYPISFEDRKHFGLISEDATGLTPENTYQITESDLGEIMGTVEISENKDLIGATIYHFAKFPDSDAICIVDINTGYEFYVNTNLTID